MVAPLVVAGLAARVFESGLNAAVDPERNDPAQQAAQLGVGAALTVGGEREMINHMAREIGAAAGQVVSDIVNGL